MTMPAKPPVAQGDLVVSILAIVLIAVVGVAASAMGLLMLAFLDSCPPDGCSETGAVASVWTAIMVAFFVGLAGVVVTIVRLVTRKQAWPFAVGTFMACGAVGVVGLVAYLLAVGA
jgi:hypothetical protein